MKKDKIKLNDSDLENVKGGSHLVAGNVAISKNTIWSRICGLLGLAKKSGNDGILLGSKSIEGKELVSFNAATKEAIEKVAGLAGDNDSDSWIR